MNEPISFEVTAQAGRKGVWTVTLSTDELKIIAVDGSESFQIARADAEEKTELRESRITKPFLIVSFPKKKVVFQLDHDQVAPYKAWLGPPTMKGLKLALRRRLRWSLPIGVLFVIISIPLPADPETGLEAVPFDAISAFLGVSLIGLGILSRFWPRRILFFLDGIWFSLLALDVAMGIFTGRDSTWWAILVIVLIFVAKSGFSEYKRFAPFN